MNRIGIAAKIVAISKKGNMMTRLAIAANAYIIFSTIEKNKLLFSEFMLLTSFDTSYSFSLLYHNQK